MPTVFREISRNPSLESLEAPQEAWCCGQWCKYVDVQYLHRSDFEVFSEYSIIFLVTFTSNN